MGSEPLLRRSRTREADGDRPDAGHDLAFGQKAVAHQPSAATFGQFVGMATEQRRDFNLNGLGPCTITSVSDQQNFLVGRVRTRYYRSRRITP
jgi:hypothetical protein